MVVVGVVFVFSYEYLLLNVVIESFGEGVEVWDEVLYVCVCFYYWVFAVFGILCPL